MTAQHNTDGTVTVVSDGTHTLSAMLHEAAQAFADRLERAVPWPVLLDTTDTTATYALGATA